MLIAAFVLQQLSAYLSGIGPGAAVDLPDLRLPIALGATGIAVVVTVLVGFGWDWATARYAAFGAVVIILLALTVSASWQLNLSGDRDLAAELWRPTQAATGVTRLRQTLAGLEDRVSERTAQLDYRARQLQTSAEVARAIASTCCARPISVTGAPARANIPPK